MNKTTPKSSVYKCISVSGFFEELDNLSLSPEPILLLPAPLFEDAALLGRENPEAGLEYPDKAKL